MNTKRTIDEFAGQENGYSRSITLKNALVPVGKTQEYIGEFIAEDKRRRAAYPEVKELIDRLHKQIIEETLSGFKADWIPLSKKLAEFQEKKNADTRKALTKEQDKMKKQIAVAFEKNPRMKKIFKEELFTEILPAMIAADDSLADKSDALDNFNKFTGYFIGFHENRKNLYSANTDHVSASYRIVNENFPRFMSNAELYKKIKEGCPAVLEETEKSLARYLNGRELDSIFSEKEYSDFLTQKGITFYNTVIVGYTESEGNVKIQGLNEHLNLYRQTHPSEMPQDIRGKMTPLYKQILSDRETPSFIPQSFQSDSEVMDAVRAFADVSDRCSAAARVLFNASSTFDTSKIYVQSKSLTAFSQTMTGKWNLVPDALKAAKKDGQKAYSLRELSEIYQDYAEDCGLDPIYDRTYFWRLSGADKTSTSVLLDRPKARFKSIDFENTKSLQANKKNASPIKDFLDSVLELYHYLSLVLYEGDNETDQSFYPRFTEIMDELKNIIPLYNKTRNYVTKKASATEKVKLNFGCPSLARGWDKNKEKTNNTLIFRKDGRFYLGILNPKMKPTLKGMDTAEEKDCYEKMVYKLLSGPSKTLPHVFFSEGGIAKYNPPEHILEGYRRKKHLLGKAEDKKCKECPDPADFDIDFLHELIDWFKGAMPLYEDWNVFGFKFSDTSSYSNISGFYKEIANQGYKVEFQKISAEKIDMLVENGSLFLFQIYNKDYAEGATGNKDLHTIYFENIFSEENLKHTVLKLNGKAEIFFRPASLKADEVSVHKTGSILVNRTASDGSTIPEELYQEIYRYLNKMTDKISDDAKALLDSGNVIHKKAEHDIVKDRRYTEDAIRFHCPITMNFQAAEIVGKKFNDKVLDYLKDNPDVNILGIDRGENHLLSCTMINQKGEIIFQTSLDSVLQTSGGQDGKARLVDYSQKLRVREKERDFARKNWQSIDSIKNLKEGYLSAAVCEVAKMMVSNNAILVMEDLGSDFKHERSSVERQVYQKFEEMLINKLNYLVFKNCGEHEPGGVLNAYQLADRFESFEKLGRQCGWIFYVSPVYTSRIDPATGFVDLFRHENVSNTKKRKEFFKDFKAIRYDSETDSFAFSFCYGEKQPGSRKEWEAYTRGNRTFYSAKEKKYLSISPTEELKNAFTSAGISWKSGENLLEKIMEIPAESHVKSSANFFSTLHSSFRNALQMRNRDLNSGEDYLISPVKASDGTFFDSRKRRKSDDERLLPENACSASAYHIALKGLFLMKNNFNRTEKGYIDKITSEQWLEFAQKKDYAA